MDFDPAQHLIMRPDALAAGFSDRELSRLVRTGALHRIRPGAYVSGQTWADLDAPARHRVRARAVLRNARTPVVLSHVSAVAEYGGPTWGLALDDVHVTRTDRRAGRNEAGVRQHQGLLRAGDVVSRGGIEVTSPTKLAIDITTVAPLEASLCVVNFLLHDGLTDQRRIWERYDAMENDPNTLRTGLVLRLADPRIESVGESRTYSTCWRQSLPAPEIQFVVVDAHGREVARLDFAWPKLGKWLEFDGREKYVTYLRPGETVTDAVLREKRREDLVREITGWQCLRITWADLADPDRLGARIRRFLAAVPADLGTPARRLA